VVEGEESLTTLYNFMVTIVNSALILISLHFFCSRKCLLEGSGMDMNLGAVLLMTKGHLNC
jgi:hypothetical protein